jgi:hypothetical protein
MNSAKKISKTFLRISPFVRFNSKVMYPALHANKIMTIPSTHPTIIDVVFSLWQLSVSKSDDPSERNEVIFICIDLCGFFSLM